MEIHQLPISQHHRHHSYLHPNHLNHFGNNSFVDSFDKPHQHHHHNHLHPTLHLNNCPPESELIDINSNTSNSASLTNLIRFDQIKTEKNTILLNKSNLETNASADFINSNNLNKKYEEDVCVGSAFNTATKPSSSMDNFCEALQQQQTILTNQRSSSFYDANNIQNRKTIFVEMPPSSLMIHPSNDLQNNNQYNNRASLLHYQEPSSSATSSLSASSSISDVINIKSLASVANASIDRKRPYPCTLCPSRFGSKMELEEHQNSHTGMKPFQCDICQSRFNRRSTLWNHKRIHSDAKPFVCTVCQMTFKWKNSLKCHKEMHFRKNETSSIQDNDIRLLTYATAAKRQLSELNNDNIKTNNNKSNDDSLLSNGIDSMKKRNHESQQQHSKLKSPSTISPPNIALKLNQSVNVGAVKNCNPLIVTDSLDDNLIKQEFTKIKPITLVNNNINSNNFSTDTFSMNRCGGELSYQNDLFSQLENETKNNFSDQDCCNNGNTSINMQLPFLNFGFQQLNNSLVAEQQQQQTNHLQNSNSSAFESFQSHQHQQQQYQHQQQQKQHNLTGLSYECGNGNFNLTTNPDSLLNNYTMLDSAILSVAAAAAATVTPSMVAATNQEGDIGTYFNYQNTLTENGNAYNNLINDNIVQQQQLNRNNGNTNQRNGLLMVSSASGLPATTQTQSMMMMSAQNLRSTDNNTTSMQSTYNTY